MTEETGLTLEALGELEYYLVDEPERIYPVEEESGYQESAPFSKGQQVREQVLGHLTAMGVALKYVHGEVGNILEVDRQLVQHEIEFQPVPIEQAADNLVLAKWVVREVAYAHGLEATFAPSVSGKGAGNGLHIHSRLVRNGASVIVRKDGLNDTGRRLIAGYLSAAKALTAFGTPSRRRTCGSPTATSHPKGSAGASATAAGSSACLSPGVGCSARHGRPRQPRQPSWWRADHRAGDRSADDRVPAR